MIELQLFKMFLKRDVSLTDWIFLFFSEFFLYNIFPLLPLLLPVISAVNAK